MLVNINSKFDEIYTTKKPVIILTGGRGSGKTTHATLFLKDLSYSKNQVILFTRYTMTSAEKSIIPEFLKRIETEGDGSNFSVKSTEIKNKITNSKILFQGIKVSSGNQTANLKGIEGLSTFVVDEGEEWQNEEDYDTLSLSIRTLDAENRTIIVMNPCSTSHFVYRKYFANSHVIVYIDGVGVQMSTHPDVCHIHTTYLDNRKNLSDKFLQEVAKMKIENPEKYGLLVIGKWNDGASDDSLFNWESVNDVFTNHSEPSNDRYIVCDAAKYGRDHCVIMVFRGWEVIHVSIFKRSDIHDIINEIEILRAKFIVSKSFCLVDGDGVGGDVVKMAGYKSFHGGAKPIKTSSVFENYKNFKTQCAFYLAENIVNVGKLKVNINNQTCKVDGVFTTKIKVGNRVVDVKDLILEDFRAIKYTNVDGEGKKGINDKEAQKALLGGRSPDYWDTINMKSYFHFTVKSVYL